MSAPNGIERRDPAAGVLTLGALLAEAHARGSCGRMQVEDAGLTHTVRLVGGRIAELAVGGHRISPIEIEERMILLFGANRPRVRFDAYRENGDFSLLINPEPLVVRGVSKRMDLFEPRALVERIPVDTLLVKPSFRSELWGLGLADDEAGFIESLARPTPTTMALWKRGLDPRRASAMVVALNLLGAFEEWSPGDLPRLAVLNRVRRMIHNGRPDHELLGIDPGASDREVDRAFRRMSLLLHPDRLAGLPDCDATRAKEAFLHLGRARDRLKRSRRSRPGCAWNSGDSMSVVGRPKKNWVELIDQAEKASSRGDAALARKLAVKVLTMSPPEHTAKRAKVILHRASQARTA